MTSIPQIPLSMGATVLVGGKLLSGTELLDYAKHKGLCSKCVQHTTHKRIKKRLGILRSEADWVPLTVKDKEAGNYIVYKGYCLQPTCWTLAEAKSMLGETPTLRSKSSVRPRTTTPGRERPSLASVDDCAGSVAHSEMTFPCSVSVSPATCVHHDPTSRYIGTASSIRSMTPGRGMGESRMGTSPHHTRTVHHSKSVRPASSYISREIESGYESSQSRASDSASTHSRDISLLGRQSSASSIISDISDRSSHRRRISRKLLDVKLHESPREVRPAMFYRQPTDSSDSSDNDSDKILEQIVKVDSALNDGAASRRDQTTRTNSRRRASIGNLIQATPRMLNNLLSDTRAIAVSTREFRNYDSTAETKEENVRITPDYPATSPVQMNEIKTSPSDENLVHSRKLRFPYGKGKSSSNIQSQQRVGVAIRRSSISHLIQLQNHPDSNSSPIRPVASNGQIDEENFVVTPHRTMNKAISGISEVCTPSKIGTVSSLRVLSPASINQRIRKLIDDKRSPAGHINVSERRSSYTTEDHVVSQNEKQHINSRRRASISFITQTPTNLSRNEESPRSISSSSDMINRKENDAITSDRTVDSYDTSPHERTPTNRRRASISNVSIPYSISSNRELISQNESVEMTSDYTVDSYGKDHHERSTTTRRRASISNISLMEVREYDKESSPQITFPTSDLLNRHQKFNDYTTEASDRNQHKKSNLKNRQRASISFVSQPSDNLLRNEMSPLDCSSSCDIANKSQRHARMSAAKCYERNCNEKSHNTARRRASMSYASQSLVNTLDDGLAHQAMPPPCGLNRHRSLGKIHDVYQKRLSDCGIAATSSALLYKRYSHNDISDDDNDAVESLSMSTDNFRDSASADLNEKSNMKSIYQNQNLFEDTSDNSIGSYHVPDDGIEGQNNSLSTDLRQSVPEIAILRHLCHQILENGSESTTVPAEHLWTSLHTRYGGLTRTENGIVDKVSTLVNVLDRSQDNECYEKCWALLSYLTKQKIGSDQNGSDSKLWILRTVSDEFDRQNFEYNAKLHAAVTISHILSEEKLSTGSAVTIWLKNMTTARRLKWISVLTDILHFRDFNHAEQRKGTLEVVDTVCYLVDVEMTNDQEEARHIHERSRLMNKLIEISFLILTALAFGTEASAPDVPALCGAVFRLLASVSSQSTLSAMDERHVECLYLIHAVMEKHASEHILRHGLLFTKQIVSKFKVADVSRMSEFDETNYRTIATTITEMVQVSLFFEQNNPSPILILETVRLISHLIESNDQMSVSIKNSVVLQRPIIVEAIIRLIDTSGDAQHADEGFFILLCLVTKNPKSGNHLRQVQSIACRLVMWLTRYRNVSVQEFICLILEYLVSSEDDSLGREVGSIGGLVVLSELFEKSEQSCSSSLSQAASRALVGVLAMVDTRILYEYNTILKKFIIDSMSSNFRSLDLQMAGLSIIHCICLRSDSITAFGTIVLPTVLKSMENHFGNVPLLTMCCSVIRMISLKMEDLSIIVETDAFKTVINTLLVHPTSTELILEGMATIKDLARKESLREHFNAEDAETAIVSILPLHSKNPDAVALIFASLNNIAVNTRTSKVAPMQLDILHFILSTLNAFRHNHQVARNACLLLKSYTYNANNLKLIRSYSEPVISTLSVCSSSPHVETRDRAQYIIKKVRGDVSKR